MKTPESAPMPDRRPLQTRQRVWAQSLAAALARLGVAPNAISIISVLFAAVAACGLSLHAMPQRAAVRAAILLAAAAAIQLRLLCNMLDGMVAIEGNRRSPTGDLYNEVPDRIADAIILVAAGYGMRELPCAIELGWLSAVLAVVTAYIRALGRSLGAPMYFHGPMAKPHRMATLTAASIAAAIAIPWGLDAWLLYAALLLVALGAVITCVRRLRLIAAFLESR